MKTLGLVTIGQAPRVDLTPEIKTILGEDVQIVEKGALDGLTSSQTKDFYPESDDDVLVTRMADGSQVKVSERLIFPKLEEKIKDLEEQGINIILLACTGEFPDVQFKPLVVKPQKVLYHVVSSLAKDYKLGVLVPDERQTSSAAIRWSNAAGKVVVEAASPYGEMEYIQQAAKRLAEHQIDMTVLDCIGYTLEMKHKVSQITDKPVILARSIVARVIKELL